MKLVYVCLLLSLPSWSMQIFIRGLEGRTFTIDIEPDETVEALKLKIEEKAKCPFDKQRIVYGGKQLEDDKSLRSYGVERASTLNLFLRVFSAF